MQEYVTGFLFDKHEQMVALVKKNRPEWQAGRWNGIGGKIEPGEIPADAMRREFWEETGLQIDEWTHFITIFGKEFRVHFFYSHADYPILNEVQTKTDEVIEVWYIDNLSEEPIIANLKWLIPMALSFAHKYEFADHFELEYKQL